MSQWGQEPKSVPEWVQAMDESGKRSKARRQQRAKRRFVFWIVLGVVELGLLVLAALLINSQVV